jgi:hypothetical protein
MQFLLEADLVTRVGERAPVIELYGADLSGTDLTNGDLIGNDLSYANLQDAGLEEANLEDADLSSANLSDANLETANLSGTDLTSADLSDADLDHAYLKGANLINAHLNNATLRNGIVDNAKLSGADLSGTALSGTYLTFADQKAIFQDSFSDKTNGWRIVGTDPESDLNVVDYATGGLRLYNPPPGHDMVVTNDIAGSAIKDAIVEVEATVTGKPPESKDTNWGIACRAGDGAGYQLGLYADGRPTIWKLKDNNWTNLDTGGPMPAVRDGTTSHLRAECWESRLTLFVNGRSVLQVEDSEIKSGSIGLYLDNSGGGAVDILFDNLLVTGHPPHF